MKETAETDCPRCKARQGFLMDLLRALDGKASAEARTIVVTLAVEYGMIRRVGGEYQTWPKTDWFIPRKQG